VYYSWKIILVELNYNIELLGIVIVLKEGEHSYKV